ncbi:Dishevelled [Parasponia andersonii]|uniref:Dishevelled n=1 Tax=Parasponia andersonii TaxID=3476 RepID=A0A2P5BN72_PARAD|nr:Dishevelled [Parasponia andersonii]
MNTSETEILKTEDGITQSAGEGKQNGKISAENEFDNKSADSNTEKSSDFQISSEKSGTIDSKIEDLVPKMICDIQILQPHSLLPKPEAPPGLFNPPVKNNDVSMSPPDNFAVDMPAIGKFIRERSNNFSAAIARKLNSFKENLDDPKPEPKPSVTEFNLSGLRVVVKLKNDEDQSAIKGRISFFSRSNCRDSTAVRRFFREKGLKFVEINIDVYPRREKELVVRTGSTSVPQIFFNEKLFGGLVALNSLRNSGDFDRRLREMVGTKCPDDAPSPPVYGFDDDEEESEEESTEEIVRIVRVLRQRLPIQDRLMKMKIVRNCFAGCELVEALIHHLDCGRRKAVDIGKQLARNHFIHHVFGENDFEDGNHFYRFLEHEPFIPKSFNFRGSTNDGQPKPAAKVGEKLTKIMSAILEAYASDDRRHVDYLGISNSEEFRRYVNLTQELHRINLMELSQEQRLAFFLNLYNAMVIHAVIRSGHPEGVMDRRFFSDFQYIVGGHPYSLSTIKNGILRNNRRPPYFLVKPFSSGDNRLELILDKVNPLIHFGLCDGTKSSPTVRFFSPQGVETQLRSAAREFFQIIGMEIDLDKRTVHLTRIIKWFSSDFSQEKEILNWIMSYLDATKAGLLTHLLSDGGPINISYKDYDWSVNS